MNFTEGQASAVIALLACLLQQSWPLAIVVILVSRLHNESNAVSWSVISSTMQATLWPTILRTDTAASQYVQWDALLLSRLLKAGSLLLLMASIITPLGLYDEIKKSSSSFVKFEYAKDVSGFGLATSPRANMPFSRRCHFEYCPGSSEVPFAVNNHTYNSHIPANLTRIFASGTLENSTVSGLFDMQYRIWGTRINFDVEGGEEYPVGAFRTVGSLLSHNTTCIVEGLVVDTVNAGIGFRNHSIPVGLEHGATWSEDLTWIEPVTECIDTNLTYNIVLNLSSSSICTYLLDNGGFANLAKDEPYPGRWGDGQNLDLGARAYRAAWFHNRLSMMYLNLTTNGSWDGLGSVDSYVGKKFAMNNHSISVDDPMGASHLSKILSSMDRIKISEIDGMHLGIYFWEGALSSDSFDEALLKLNETLKSQGAVQATQIKYLETICNGIGGSDTAEVLTPHVQCSSLLGIPNRQTGWNSIIRDKFSHLTQPIYICASGIRASLKTVDFLFNGTSTLDSLRVARIQDKLYIDKSTKPLWAVERTGLNISSANPLWGIVSDDHENAEGLWTHRAEKLWLPAVDNWRDGHWTEDSCAGANAPGEALVNTIRSSTDDGFIIDVPHAEYSGTRNFLQYRLWQQLSQEASTVPRIINLIFTDILASAVVGTKSLNSTSSDTFSAKPARWPVIKHVKTVSYNYIYSIPAFAFIGVWLSIIVIACFSWVKLNFSIDRMRQLFNRTSMGRVVTTIAHPGLCDPSAPTNEWVAKAGSTTLDIRNLGNKGTIFRFDGMDGYVVDSEVQRPGT